MNLRAAAARVLFQVVVEGQSLSECLPQQLSKLTDARDRALLQAICFGVCRWYFRLDAIAQQLLDKPLKEKDQDVYLLLLVGLYQLLDMRIPTYAAVSETVAATKSLKKIWAKALINGVLRQYQRNAEKLSQLALDSHPEWFIEKVKKTYPNEWKNILNANNQHPPFSLRVNQQQISREKYLEKISKKEMSATIISETQTGIFLADAVDVTQLPGFSDGMISVQDGAAQLAAELLQLKSGQRVLDACAAPGGKTAHMLEIEPKLAECVVVDNSAARMDTVHENLKRLKLQATCKVADVGNVKSWWDESLFDRILLDAPCSASGVIRRHPDIKLLRRESDIANLAKEQLRLLKAVWTTLKPGGLLLYVTCSIFAEENVQVIKEFLQQQPDAKEEKIAASWGMACEIGRQILPGMNGMDGFYYCSLRK